MILLMLRILYYSSIQLKNQRQKNRLQTRKYSSQSPQPKFYLMKGTIFQDLLQIYTLKIPPRKHLPKRIFPYIQNLASSFYSHIFKIIKAGKNSVPIVKPVKKNSLVDNLSSPRSNTNQYLSTLRLKANPESIQEAYTNLFYNLESKSHKILDFISCLICLLGNVLFTNEAILQDSHVQAFIDWIASQNMELRQYLLIVYIEETIHYSIARETALKIFNQFIIQENLNQTNIGDKLRFKNQIKQVKENLDKFGSLIVLRPRNKKAIAFGNYQDQLNCIMQQNRAEIQEQNKTNMKFQKLLGKCFNQEKCEGKEDSNRMHERSLPKKSQRQIKISSYLKTLKLIQSTKRTPILNKMKQQPQKNFDHWCSVLNQMKNLSYLNKIERISALQSSILCRENSQIVQPTYLNRHAEQQNVTYCLQNQQSQSNLIKQTNQRPLNQKKTKVRYNNILPDLKQYNKPCSRFISEEDPQPSVVKAKPNSRILKKQFDLFLTQRGKSKKNYY